MIQTVIQKRIASYVFFRNGIYYFQLRLKKNDHRRSVYKSGLVRKSLKTSNYNEAVLKARSLWYEYVMTKKNVEQTQDEIDTFAQREIDLFKRGKAIHEQFSELNEDDEGALDYSG